VNALDDLRKAIARHLADRKRIAELEMLASACIDENNIWLQDNAELEERITKLEYALIQIYKQASKRNLDWCRRTAAEALGAKRTQEVDSQGLIADPFWETLQ